MLQTPMTCHFHPTSTHNLVSKHVDLILSHSPEDLSRFAYKASIKIVIIIYREGGVMEIKQTSPPKVKKQETKNIE